MSKCEHISWIEPQAGKAAPQLVYGCRLARLVGELPDPSTQLPQVVFFIGRREKNLALRQLCHSNYRGHHRYRTINLRSDNRTSHSSQPRFFADWDPTYRSLPPAFESPRICHLEKVLPLELSQTECSVFDFILSRLLFLFVDVLCVFADDVGGLESVRELLSGWTSIGSASSLPRVSRPRVIVVAGDQTQSVTHRVLDEEDFMFNLLHVSEIPFFAAFGEIQISRLPSAGLSPEARYITLGSEISRQLRKARHIRERHRTLFSATHLNAFFELAVHNISTAPMSSFNFIRSSRQQNPIDGAFTSHLVNFINIGNRTRLPYDDMASHVASAILMDAYPPGMHGTCIRVPLPYSQ